MLLSGRSAAAAETPYGQRCSTIAACDQAMLLNGNAQSMWAAAVVRVTRPEPPTTDELLRADLLASAAVRMAPGEPWGYLARVEIARRWGDAALLERRVEELRQVAPAHPETLRALAQLHPATNWARRIGIGALALICLLTAAHALRRVVGQRAVAVAVALLLFAGARTAAAGNGFPIDDLDPERAVPTQAQADAAPLDFAYYLQEMTDRAENAARRGDHAAAARYYRALARAVPDSSVPEQKLCTELLQLDRIDDAIVACHAALALPGVRAEDFVRFGNVVLAQRAPTAKQLRQVESAAGHLAAQTQPELHEMGRELQARLYVVEWSHALDAGRVGEARALIEKARAAGLPEEGLARMHDATDERASNATSRRLITLAGVGGLFLGATLVLLGLLRLARARRVRRRREPQWTTTISGNS